ncbi:hypothetical protein [Piscibacillus salipiscarius]|uniref:hypothetical protein n=1 Tax=Piscibacillus salipiscarius TaxID=299480 RepID=UPI0006D17D7A|nr:hypothetical protein [Piscibacillus salipiscarius]
MKKSESGFLNFENDSNVIFPYQAYYPFPATPELFNDDEVSNWLFYKNPDEDRLIIVYHDQKKYNYAHVVYLWDDLFNQPGAWETIYEAHKTLQQQHDEELKIRTDLTDESRKLINDDAFEIQDPWVLHGVWV